MSRSAIGGKTPKSIAWCVVLALLCLCLLVQPAAAQGSAAQRGKYIYAVAGCFACHTDGKSGHEELSGGPPLVTPFGTFYAPNITPDREHGIGKWSDEDFLRAIRTGIGPQGQHYYPAFPYPSYSQAKKRDLLDLKAYIFTLPPAQRKNRPHSLTFPFSYRFLNAIWKVLNFTTELWTPDDTRSEAWNRGSYLVNALAHCGECHTPRNVLGALDRAQWLSGAPLDDGRSFAANLTSHKTGLAGWSAEDIVTALEFGLTPDNDVLGDEMAEVVRHATSKMTKSDLNAIATYLKTLPALKSTKGKP